MTERTIKLTTEQALHLRMRGQGLLPQYSRVTEPDVAAEVACFTGGLQAQDLFAATLGVRVRAAGSTLAGFEESRVARRSVIWTWLMRGTLHVVASEDIDWLLAVIGQPMIAATTRRRGELGLNEQVYAEGLRVIVDRLAASGPQTREELGQALAQAGLPNGYPIERHLLFRAAYEGYICFGRDRGDAPGVRPTFTLLPDWLGRPLAQLSSEDLLAAQVRLAHRYLGAFAPANLTDFSAWSGVNARDLRAAWNAVRQDLVQVEVGGQTAFVPAERMVELDEKLPSPVVRLLPAFDTYILGHGSRGPIDPGGRYTARLRGGGILPATVLVDGRILGTWQTNRKGRRVAVTVEPFEPFLAEVEAAVAAEVADIERFVGSNA